MWGFAALAGLALGALAFAADFCTGALAIVMLLLCSSTFAWGAAALVAGYLARDRRTAAGAAVTLLALATAGYYGLILIEDGSSAFASVLRASAFWLAASVAGGVLLGPLGQAIRRGAHRRTWAAAGFLVLAGPGAVTALRLAGVPAVRPWFVEAVAEVAAAGAVTVLLVRRAARDRK